MPFNYEVGKPDEFRVLIEALTDSILSNLCNRWKYFGVLSVEDMTEKKASTILDIWTAMLERRLGTESFRVIIGKQEKRDSINTFHVFIGGITPQKAFERFWIERWVDLGGSRATLFPFEPCLVRAYAEELSPQLSFDCTVKKTTRTKHR